MAAAWRLLDTWDGEPGFHMALDEALLLAGPERPTLRFYTWRPAALSLGYFQRVRDVPAIAEAPACVRRLTGGGAIHHADELTFAITAPQDHPLYRGEVRASYERVHAALAEAFRELGVQADLRRSQELSSDLEASGMCFHVSTPLDLAWDARKGVGSAQRRTGGRVLHHGSIKLGASALEPGVATLRSHAPEVTPGRLAERIAACFERRFECHLERDEITPEEHERAQERAGFFTSEAFVRRR